MHLVVCCWLRRCVVYDVCVYALRTRCALHAARTIAGTAAFVTAAASLLVDR